MTPAARDFLVQHVIKACLSADLLFLASLIRLEPGQLATFMRVGTQ